MTDRHLTSAPCRTIWKRASTGCASKKPSRCAVTDRTSLRPLPDDLEARLSQAARAFAYPPTPDLTRAVTARRVAPRRAPTRLRLALAGALLALLLAVILAVPPVRAAVLAWIRVGAVRIFLVQPTPLPAPTALPGTLTPPPAPTPTPTPLASVLDLSGETSLEAASTLAGFDVRLPAGLGPPDRVFFQDLGGPLVILVWLEPERPGQVRLALFETNTEGVIFQKVTPRKIADTSVNGQPAVWVDGPYMLITGSGDATITRLVYTGHTLVWTTAGRTYRLETALPLEEALKIAEEIK